MPSSPTEDTLLRIAELYDSARLELSEGAARENTEDLYAGIGGYLKKGTPDEVAHAVLFLASDEAAVIDQCDIFAFRQRGGDDAVEPEVVAGDHDRPHGEHGMGQAQSPDPGTAGPPARHRR